MNNTIPSACAGLLHKEKVTLSKSILHSMLNLTVQQHNAFKSGNLFPSELAVEISNTNLSGIDAIIRDSHQIMEFEDGEDGLTMKLSYKKLQNLLFSSNNINSHRELLIEFLNKGASTICLHDLFNMSKAQVVSLRKHHSITISSGGRPDAEETYEARYQFDKIHTDPSKLRTDLLKVSEQHSIPLNTVWLSVRAPDKQNLENKEVAHAK